MANTYTHYGINVVRQILDSPFIITLMQNNVKFIELPLIEHQVLKYETNGIKKYALIQPLNIPDDYLEAVYITTAVPDDGNWTSLIYDIDAQHNDGAEPAQMPSRLKFCTNVASENAFKTLSDKYPAKNFGELPEIPENEFLSETVIELARLGWTKDDLLCADSHDVNQEYLEKIKNIWK